MATPCPSCPKGHFNPLTAQTFCPFICPPGKYGLYEGATNDTACSDCPKGHTCVGGLLEPEPCPLGTYTEIGSSKCIVCGPGKYSSELGDSTCTACPIETPNSAPGSKSESECTSTLVCPNGMGKSDDGTRCMTCSGRGYYSPDASTGCDGATKCPVGTFSSDIAWASGCQPCPFGTVGILEGSKKCIECPEASLCPVGSTKVLTPEQVNIRNGNVMQIYNTQAIIKPEKHCKEESGEVDIILYGMFGLSALIVVLHTLWINVLLSCISYFKRCGVSEHKVLNRLDKLQTEWGHWEGNGDKKVIKPPKPSHFGAAYTIAFLPIAFYTIFQLVMANNPKCTAGLQVLGPNRAKGKMEWTIELPTVASTTCVSFDSSKTAGFSEASIKPTVAAQCNKVSCFECKLDAENELYFNIPYTVQVANITYMATVAAPGEPPQISWVLVRPKNGSWVFNENAEIIQTFQARESFFQDKTIGRFQGVKVGDTGEEAHSGFFIQAEPRSPTTSMESESTLYTSDSTWVLRIRILRADSMQYVEKAHLQDSVQLFFAIIAAVTGTFGIWVGAFYGWGVFVYEKAVRICRRMCRRKDMKISHDVNVTNKKQIAKPHKIKYEQHAHLNDRIEKLEVQVQETNYQLKEIKRMLQNLSSGSGKKTEASI
eukprot:g8757.t1